MEPICTQTNRPTSTGFSPTPDATESILSALADPDLSLHDIAHDHGATLDALTLWLAREDISERLQAIERTAARRARLVATSHLATVAAAMARLIQDTDDECAHVPVNPKSLPALEQRRRTRETARRAASLLLRLSRFTSVPLAARPPVLPPSSSSPSSLSSSSALSSSSSDLFRPLSPVGGRERPGEGSCFCLPSSTRLRDASPSDSDPLSPKGRPERLHKDSSSFDSLHASAPKGPLPERCSEETGSTSPDPQPTTSTQISTPTTALIESG